MPQITEDKRPSADAILQATTDENAGRGKLKVFLGAAPGVGKTYEMLLSGKARLAEGVDVVAAVIETHGRQETQALLEGFEITPRRKVEYRGRLIDEMDLDAVLARKPQIALVDELAHTNAPGSRHPKRYLDVEELLAAGIDVYTTLNIQHVESLHDVVAQITHIRVRETVPDSVLDKADDIEVIDLAPSELIQRLRDGKVYVPKQAERALNHYFSPGNLTALRELALRRTAQRVDEQLLTHMQSHAIDGPWPAGERLLVCISEHPGAAGLVRYTKRLGDKLRAPWTALYIETARSQDLSIVERDRVADTLRLAERLGGIAATIPGGDRVVDDVIAFARANNVTQIVLGKSKRTRWFELLNGSVVHDLVRCSGNIGVTVVSGDALNQEGIPKKTVKTAAPSEGFNAAPYVVTIAATAVCTAAAMVMQPFFGIETVALVFLMAVIGIANRFGLRPSLFAAFACMLSYNFFFLPPLYTFTIADPTNVAALFFFLFTAVVVSNITARARRQALTAQQRATTTDALYAFSKQLAGIMTQDELLATAASQVAALLEARVVILLPDAAGSLAVKGAFPDRKTVNEADMGAADWSFRTLKSAGRGSDTLPGVKRLFLPLRTGRGAVGVVGLDRGQGKDFLLTPDERRLLDALMDQTAVAIERVKLAAGIDEARLETETERLRGALLTSLSHDLKTPLASILGAASSLRLYRDVLDPGARDDLAETIEQEAARMSRFVANLLDMTRIEAGGVAPHREPVEIAEAVGAALNQASISIGNHRIEVNIASGLPLLNVDALLLEQVLINLLDNAAKYSPSGSTISIRAMQTDAGVAVDVLDEGGGVADHELERIFEKFYRAQNGDRKQGGSGLGLAICKGFMTALGGKIDAISRGDRSGAQFRLTFPSQHTVAHTIAPSEAA